MTAPADTAQSIQAALEPFVRPREEVAHVRRVLRAHLAASLKSDDDALNGSLALVDIAWDTAPLPEVRGLQRAYLRALQANLEARREFDQRAAVAADAASASSAAAAVAGLDAGQDAGLSSSSASSIGILQDHLTTVKLGRKRDRLQVVNRYLDALGERPVAVAAGEDYLHPEFIYGDATTTLPSVPKAVVDGLAEDETERATAAAAAPTKEGEASSTRATKPMAAADLERLVAQLEKSALRAQLVLRQEEKRLVAAKERSARRSTSPSAAAKLQALGVARDELIAWMETELSNAGDEADEEDEEVAESSRQLRQSLLNGHEVVGGVGGIGSSDKKIQLEDKLDDIRDKYNQYVEARRALVATVGTMAPSDEGTAKTVAPNPLFANMPQLQPNSGVERTVVPTAPSTPIAATTPAPVSRPAVSGPEKAVALGNLLLAPYLERLLAVARDQKADIAHKAHYNVLLSKRLKDTCQMLDHLADESQLLPRFGPSKSGGGAGGAGGGGAALLRKKGMLAPAQGAAGAAAEGAGQRVAAWTYAADSAKIATFEAVFEKVEEGQVALEQATQSLVGAELLLGRKPEGEEPSDAKVENRKPGTKQKQQGGDIWATLDGELGLLKADSRR